MAGDLVTADAKKQEEYFKILEDCKATVLDLFKSDHWKNVSGNSLEKGIISYQHVKRFGRNVFRLQCKVDLPARDLWEHIYKNNNKSVQWNKSVTLIKTLQKISDNAVVGYSTAAEALGGLITARDFVNLRQWLEIKPDLYLHQGVGCEHPAMPEQKKFVRGNNGPGGMFFEVCPDNSTHCHLTWIVNADPKGWIPQAAVDKAMKGMFEDFFSALKQFYKDGIPAL